MDLSPLQAAAILALTRFFNQGFDTCPHQPYVPKRARFFRHDTYLTGDDVYNDSCAKAKVLSIPPKPETKPQSTVPKRRHLRGIRCSLSKDAGKKLVEVTT